MKNQKTCRGLLIALVLGAASFTALAEGEERMIYQLEPKADERVPEGKTTMVTGETDATGTEFLLEGTNMLQPIAVGVYTSGPDENVRVRIAKESFDAPAREAATDGSGKVEFKFRTFDGFKVQVTSDTPTAYQLVVWVGDEIVEVPPSFAVPASEYREPAAAASPDRAGGEGRSGGVSLSYLELGLIVTLALVVIGFGFFVLSRRKAGQNSSL